MMHSGMLGGDYACQRWMVDREILPEMFAQLGTHGAPDDIRGDTVWLTQHQMSALFDATPENVLMHLKNIFQDEELLEQAAKPKPSLEPSFLCSGRWACASRSN